MAFDLQAFRCSRDIGFRVEVHDRNHPKRNCTFDKYGNMRARNPMHNGDAQACRDHLRWKGGGGPFISFFASWRAALCRRQTMIGWGAREVIIVAVWLRGLPRVYDASLIAKRLGLEDLHLFRHEVLVHGTISADSYRILAIFNGNSRIRDVTLSIPGLNIRAKIPGDVIDEAVIHDGMQPPPDVTNALRDEVYIHTGTRDDAKFIPLALSMSIAELGYTSQVKNGIAEIHGMFPIGGKGWSIAKLDAV
ncbi:hypothetical protein V8C35DRAFT_296684 [Trichoderma chlorosporum]